jgi:hypothetical protein
MWGRRIAAGILYSIAPALALSAVATIVDWKMNPHGLFHDSSGTNWDVTLSTAWSWFVPALALFFLLWTAGVILYQCARIRGRRDSG